MISRLVSLELSGFRCFRDQQNFSLDADVVLIQGANGTGKTSLLNAIEFALTGQVAELARFKEDYPRCLRNVDSSTNGYVGLALRSDSVSEPVVKLQLSDANSNLQGILTPADAQFFIDRCYLSQTSLSRLLENYQLCTGDNPEQPLVRFIRELLGLDLLENVTAGLYEAAHINRIENSVPSLARLRTEDDALRQKVEEIQAYLPTRSAAWEASLINVQRLSAELGDPLPNASWNPDGVARRAEAYEGNQQETTIAAQLQQVRNAQGRVQRALGLLGESDTVSSSPTLHERFASLTRRKQEIEELINPALLRAEGLLTTRGMVVPLPDDLGARCQAVGNALSVLIAEVRTQMNLRERTEAEIAELERRLATHDAEIASLGPNASAESATIVTLASALSTILQHTTGNDCPVCGRDYTETGHGNLSDHIAAEIESLGANAKRLEDIANRLAQATISRDTAKQALATLRERTRTGEANAGLERGRYAQLQQSAEELKAFSEVTAEWKVARDELATLTVMLRTAEVRDREKAEAATELEAVFVANGSPENLRRPDQRAFAHSLIGLLQQHANVLQQQAAMVAKFRDALRASVVNGKTWKQAEEELASSSRRLREVQARLSQVDRLRESARNLSKAATTAKSRTLDRIFNQELNTLWQQLFRRLVKHEPFQPQLHHPRTVRGQIRTSIGAWREGVSPFKQFAAIASSGNLNTAALSLFLALHLIEKPRHRLLILDDPIQNIDDLHVVQLANLLRQIRQKAQRQLILAVHDRALFDYLRIELGPTMPEASMITLELARDTNGSVAINTTVHRWEPGKVRFGAEAGGR